MALSAKEKLGMAQGRLLRAKAGAPRTIAHLQAITHWQEIVNYWQTEVNKERDNDKVH